MRIKIFEFLSKFYDFFICLLITTSLGALTYIGMFVYILLARVYVCSNSAAELDSYVKLIESNTMPDKLNK